MTPKYRRNVIKKRFVIISLLVVIVITVGGCANYNKSATAMAGDNTNSTGLTDTEIKQYLLEWQEAKPGITRLTELESDLAFLIAEVSKMSDLNSAPDKYVVEGDKVGNGDNVIVAKMVPPNDDAVAAKMESLNDEVAAVEVVPKLVEPFQNKLPLSTEYAVHIASFLKPKSANFGWYVIQQEYPALMQGLIPKLQQIKRKSQQLYSLRVGPFLTNQQAYSACNALKRKNYQCQLTTFDGTTLEL